VHGFIGGGAFPRNHTPRDHANINLPVLHLGIKSAGPSQPPNPKWKSRWRPRYGDPRRHNEVGEANFLSPPRYTKDGGVPAFDKGGRFSELGRFIPWPAPTSTWEGPVAGTVNPRVKNEHGKSHELLVREEFDASEKWAVNIESNWKSCQARRKAGHGHTNEYGNLAQWPYKQPSQATTKKAWKDLRTQGKIHCSSGETDIERKINRAEEAFYRNTGEPAVAEVTEWRWAARYGFCFPSAKYPDREAALVAFAAWRTRVGFPTATICEPPHGNRWHVDVVERWERKLRKKRCWPATDNKIGGAKIPRVRSAEHGGNVVISRNPQRSNFYGVPGKKIKPDAVISYGIDIGYGDSAPDCVSADAALRNRGIADKKPTPNRREVVDWNWLAQCARGGSSDAYNKMLVAARPIAEILERRYNSHSSTDLVGDLVTVGLFGVASKKTGKVSNGVKYAVTKWEAVRGNFLPFMTASIRNAMVAYIRAETSKGNMDSVSLNTDLPLSEDGDVFQDLVTADDVYGVHGERDEFDYDTARAKLDQIMRDQLTNRQRDVITERYLLNGPTTQPNQEELAAKWGVKRQVISKDEIAAKELLGIKD
jgi:hypothetical protein